MEKLVIEGGVPLSGTVVPAGNKNAALPLLAACLLTEEQVVLHNVPRIRDTEALMALLENLGVKIERRDGNTVALQADEVTKTDVDPDLAERIRASFLVAGSAARALRRGAAAAAGRRRDRPPPARPAPRRVQGARRARRARARHPPARARTAACRRATSSWTSRP